MSARRDRLENTPEAAEMLKVATEALTALKQLGYIDGFTTIVTIDGDRDYVSGQLLPGESDENGVSSCCAAHAARHLNPRISTVSNDRSTRMCALTELTQAPVEILSAYASAEGLSVGNYITGVCEGMLGPVSEEDLMTDLGDAGTARDTFE